MICLTLIFSTFSAAQDEDPEIDLPELTSDSSGGKFEIGLHYSSWSLNALANWFAEELSDRVGREIRDEVYRHVRDEYAGIYNTDYEHDMAFDSDGNNYGMEFRFYPKGKGSRFSIGFSIEKNRMNMIVQGTVNQNFSDGSHAEVESELFL